VADGAAVRDGQCWHESGADIVVCRQRGCTVTGILCPKWLISKQSRGSIRAAQLLDPPT